MKKIVLILFLLIFISFTAFTMFYDNNDEVFVSPGGDGDIGGRKFYLPIVIVS